MAPKPRAMSILDMRKQMKARAKSQASIEANADDSDAYDYSESEADPLAASEQSGMHEIIGLPSGNVCCERRRF